MQHQETFMLISMLKYTTFNIKTVVNVFEKER